MAGEEGAILPGLSPFSLLRAYLWLCMLVHDVSQIVIAGQGPALVRMVFGEGEMDA